MMNASMSSQDYSIRLRNAVFANDIAAVKQFISFVDFNQDESYDTLYSASRSGSTEILAFILPYYLNQTSKNTIALSKALRLAADNNHIECVKLLLPVSNPQIYDSYALRMAARKGCTEIVKLLIPVSDTTALKNSAFLDAAEEGHFDIVQLLLPYSLPGTNEAALRKAAMYSHPKIIHLLLPHTDYNDVLNYLNNKWYDITCLKQCIEEYETTQQQERLTTHIEPMVECAIPSVKRKI